jgi:hypothetical protein
MTTLRLKVGGRIGFADLEVELPSLTVGIAGFSESLTVHVPRSTCRALVRAPVQPRQSGDPSRGAPTIDYVLHTALLL